MLTLLPNVGGVADVDISPLAVSNIGAHLDTCT